MISAGFELRTSRLTCWCQMCNPDTSSGYGIFLPIEWHSFFFSVVNHVLTLGYFMKLQRFSPWSGTKAAHIWFNCRFGELIDNWSSQNSLPSLSIHLCRLSSEPVHKIVYNVIISATVCLVVCLSMFPTAPIWRHAKEVINRQCALASDCGLML